MQAARNPTLSTMVYFTYRGTFVFGNALDSWHPDIASNIVQWMLWPEAPILPPVEPVRREVVLLPKAGGRRVPSGGSETSQATSSATSSTIQSSDREIDAEQE